METTLKDEAFKSKKLGKVVPVSCIFDDAQLDRFSKLIPNLGILALLLPELGIQALLPELGILVLPPFPSKLGIQNKLVNCYVVVQCSPR